MPRQFLNTEVQITRTVSLYPLIEKWVNDLKCETPEKKKRAGIGPFKTGDTFIGKRPKASYMLVCRNKEIVESDYCRACRAKQAALRLLGIMDEVDGSF